jgi:hypothetical protein
VGSISREEKSIHGVDTNCDQTSELLRLLISAHWVWPVTSKNSVVVEGIGGGTQRLGTPNHLSAISPAA